MELAKMLVLSTEHLTPATCNVWLHNAPSAAFEKGEYGWFVYVADDTEGFPAELRAVLNFARSRGIEWVMFDRDADTLDELPVFDWSRSVDPITQMVHDVLERGREGNDVEQYTVECARDQMTALVTAGKHGVADAFAKAMEEHIGDRCEPWPV